MQKTAVSAVTSGAENVVLNIPPVQESTLIWIAVLFFLVGALVGGILALAYEREKPWKDAAVKSKEVTTFSRDVDRSATRLQFIFAGLIPVFLYLAVCAVQEYLRFVNR